MVSYNFKQKKVGAQLLGHWINFHLRSSSVEANHHLSKGTTAISLIMTRARGTKLAHHEDNRLKAPKPRMRTKRPIKLANPKKERNVAKECEMYSTWCLTLVRVDTTCRYSRDDLTHPCQHHTYPTGQIFSPTIYIIFIKRNYYYILTLFYQTKQVYITKSHQNVRNIRK